MSEILRPTNLDVIIDTYAQKTALRLGVDVASIRAEFKKSGYVSDMSRSAQDADIIDEPTSVVTETPPSEREFWLLRFILLHDDQMGWAAQHLDLNWLQHPVVKRIIAGRLAAHANETWRGLPALIDAMDDDAARDLITEAVAVEQKKSDIGRNIVEAVRLLRTDHIDRQLAALKVRLAHPELPEAEAMEILREQAELRRTRQQPLG